jgi:hypothetical protein
VGAASRVFGLLTRRSKLRELARQCSFNNGDFVVELASYVNRLRVRTALEVGARSGELLAGLELAGVAAAGIEIDEVAAREASRFLADRGLRATVRYQPGGVAALGAGQRWDLVFSSGVLEHYDASSIVSLIQEMAGSSGRYVLNLVPSSDCRPYQAAKRRGGHEWCAESDFTPDALAALHREAGLEVVARGFMARQWGRAWDPTIQCRPRELPYLVFVLAVRGRLHR